MKTSRLTAIEDGMGAKLATNGDTCNFNSELLSQGLFLREKCIVGIRTRNVCKPCDVARAWHYALFFDAGVIVYQEGAYVRG